MVKKEKILVTGGAGFIGSWIVKHYMDRGDYVWAVDNLQTGRVANLAAFRNHPDFHFDCADVSCWEKLSEAVQWADKIYHMAANVGQRLALGKPIQTLTNNIEACEAVLQAMVNVKSQARLLIASTSELYFHSQANADGTLSEEATMVFWSGKFLQEAYPASKHINEVMALSYAYEENVYCTIARLFNTIGPMQSAAYGMVVPNFIREALANQPVTVFGDGLQTRSFNDVRDTVDALSLLLDNPEARGEIVNVGGDYECSIRDLAKMIIKKTQSKSEIAYIPYKEAYGVDFVDVKKRCPDLRKLKQFTGFRPKYNLEQTIEAIIEETKQKNSNLA